MRGPTWVLARRHGEPQALARARAGRCVGRSGRARGRSHRATAPRGRTCGRGKRSVNAQDLERLDRAARRLARQEFSRPLVLEAGAGTGKTAALVARVAVWTLTRGWERARRQLGAGVAAARLAERVLERVAMITFTDKAAVEMERRVAEAFGALALAVPVPGLPVEELGLAPQALAERATALG